jgi:Patatin-like phospholipase
MEKKLFYPVTPGKHDDDDMLRDELATLAPDRPESLGKLNTHLSKGNTEEGPYSIGLALSGGGIRSATVSLGVMQKLAGAGLLKHVDYLSTVSGGGFIGSALTWWLHNQGNRKNQYDVGEKFPFGTVDPKLPELFQSRSTPLQFLRSNGNYLTPGNGISLWSGISIFLRAIFLNLMIWIPVTALIMLILFAAGRLPFLKGLPFFVRTVAPGSLETVAEVVGSSGQIELNQTIPPVFLLSILIAIALFALFLLGSISHSLLSWTDADVAAKKETVLAEADQEARGKWYSWLLVGLVGLLGIATLIGTLLWTTPLLKPLFDWGGGRSQGGMVSITDIVSSDLWVGYLLWAIAVCVTLLCFWRIGAISRLSWLDIKGQMQIFKVLAALLLVLVAASLTSHLQTVVPRRLSPFLQFIFSVSFLVYAYYLTGLMIRHILRDQHIGKMAARIVKPAPSLLQYHARRVFEWFFGGAIKYSLVCIAVGTLPLVNHYIGYKLGGTWTAAGLALTAFGQVWGRVAGHGRFTNVVIVVGAIVLCYGVLLIGYDVSRTVIHGTVMQRALIVAVMVIALVSGWFVNTNHIGLHRYYRDRLMEAFMPDEDQMQNELNHMASGANGFKLSDAWPVLDAKGPYHIVNTNVVLSKSETRKYHQRAGDNFILSPLYMGSSATGWHRTSESFNKDMTLASAMAISGAAANPRGAAGGRGITRNAAVSIIMSLLNVRLGYWIPNPRHSSRRRFLPVRPNHFWPGGIYALARRGYTEDSKWLELADGGHFENLAIYELVRRRCGLIIVCDGGQDNASSYADLVTAVERIGSDFGATVFFDMEVAKEVPDKNKKPVEYVESTPAQMIAKPTNTDYPKGAEFADKGYVVARIDYGDRGGRGYPKSGILLYLKSTLIKDLGIRAKGYRGAHPDFPNQSTSDQFFDEEQFEAYREVGYRLCKQMVDDLELKTLFNGGPPRLIKLRSNAAFKSA